MIIMYSITTHLVKNSFNVIFNVIIKKKLRSVYFKANKKETSVLLKKNILLHTQELSFNYLMPMQET